jgi:hypothetical protein
VVNGLSKAVTNFLTSVGAEVIPESNQFRCADYVFRDENVVIEQKTLEEAAIVEHRRKLQLKVNEWMRRGRIMAYGRVMLDLRQVPSDCRYEWLRLLQPPIESIVRDANRQIRSTKLHEQLPMAKGLVLVVNEGNLLYETPADYLAMVARVLQKKTPSGQPRFADVDGVIYLSMTPYLGGMRPTWQAGFVHMHDTALRTFINGLQQQWFAFVSRGRLIIGDRSPANLQEAGR